jgi:DNA replication factor GINS
MNLDELRSVQSKERQKDSLQNLRPSFYQEVGEYIADLEAERERVAEATDDPFSSPEIGRLTDEIETAKDVVEAVYERRMGKLVKQASLAAAGMPANDDGLTAEEADLFEDLVERIRSNKGRVLDVLEGVEVDASGATDADPTPSEPDVSVEEPTTQPRSDDTPPTPPNDPDPVDVDASGPAPADSEPGSEPETASDDGGVTAADVMGGVGPAIDADDVDQESATDDPEPPVAEAEPPEPHATADKSTPADDGTPSTGRNEPASEAERDPDADAGSQSGVDRVTVRITRDLGSILGVDDREYTLSSDDVVTLPEQNATPLVERDAAEPLE